MLARLLALAIGTLALAALRAQFDAMRPVDLGEKLWYLAGFFTILTNLLVAAHMFAIARGWRIGASRAAGLVVSIVMVGIVYHAVLARLWAPQGLAWWADQGLHTAVPLATALWWLAFAPKDVGWRDVPVWLIWPLAYCGYALVRGVATGFWPDPFLNVDTLGWGMVAVNIVALVLVFAALGAGVVALARRVGSGEAVLLQQGPAGPILQFQHPQVGVAGALAGQNGVHVPLGPLGQHNPDAGIRRHVETALKGPRLPVQRGDLDQNRAGCGIALGRDEHRDGRQPQPVQIGRNPKA